MSEIVHAKLTVLGDNPMGFNIDSENIANLDIVDQNRMKYFANVFQIYLKEIQELVDGEFAQFKDLLPPYLTTPGQVFVFLGADGIIVRYETHGEKKLAVGLSTDGIADLVAILSQNFIHIYSPAEYATDRKELDATLQLDIVNPVTNEKQTPLKWQVGIDFVLDHLPSTQKLGKKAEAIIAARNYMELHLRVESDDKEEALIVMKTRFPYGWEYIEVFTTIDPESWKPEFAPLWAKNDIQTAILSSQIRRDYFSAIDPSHKTRQNAALLLKSFKELLDSGPTREEELQTFLKANPVLLCPDFLKMFPKLPLGRYVTDFVFRRPNNSYLLVELEKSTHLLFKEDGGFNAQLNHARDQISDWKRYIADNLKTVQDELDLEGISPHPESLIVIGRSNVVTSENRRKLVTSEIENPKQKIMTYDDIYDYAKSVFENILGTIWDETENTEVYVRQTLLK